MKKFTFFLLGLSLSLALVAQQVPRDYVVYEIFTGVNCQYCPGAAQGAIDMIANGKKAAIAEIHAGYYSIPQFNNSPENDARASYYSVSGYPTTKVDGILSPSTGGSAGSSTYNAMLGAYNTRIAVDSDFELELSFENVGTDEYEATVVVNNVNNFTGDAIVHIFLTESDIEYAWLGGSDLHYVVRDMMPDQNGTSHTFTGGDTFTVTEAFSTADYVKNNCELIAFIQNPTNKEVLQGTWKTMETPDFISDVALKSYQNICTGNCSGLLAPEVEIQNLGADILQSFTLETRVNGTLVNAYDWTGSIEFPESTIIQMPEFSFSETAPYDIEIKVTDPNGGTDENLENNSVEAEADAAVNNGPEIQLILKTDDNPQQTSVDIINTTTGVVEQTITFTTPNQMSNQTLTITTPGCHQVVVRDAAGNGLANFWTLMGDDGVIANGTANTPFWYAATAELNVEMTGVFAIFSSDETETCEGPFEVQFTDMSQGNPTSWAWEFEGGTPATSTEQNPTVTFDGTGSYTVSLTVSDGTDQNTTEIEDYITIFGLPELTFAEFTYPSNFECFCSNYDEPYELTEGTPAGGEYSGDGVVDGFFNPEDIVSGTVVITYTYTDENGCMNTIDRDAVVQICSSVEEVENSALQVYPNPVSDQLTYSISQSGTYSITILNSVGKVVLSKDQIIVNGSITETIDINNLSNGLYYMMINNGTDRTTQKIIVNK